MITPDLLRSLDLFASLSDATLHKIAQVSADVRLNPGEYLIREGDAAAFFVQLEGEIEVIKEVAGAPQHLGTYRTGSSFGELPLLLGSSATASLQATLPSRVLRLDAPDFRALLSHSDAVAGAVMANLTRRVDTLERVILETPVSMTLLVGQNNDLDCFGLREFLSGNGVPFRWLDPMDEVLKNQIPEQALGQPLPLAVLPDGEVLVRPRVRELARRVGLQVTPAHGEYDLIIVGGGPAGLAAAVYGASEGLSTLLLEKQAPGGQAGTSSRIENYLGFPNGISGGELSERALQQAKRFGAEVVITRQAVELRPAQDFQTVVLDGGDTLRARSVLLTMGVEWRTLALDGARRLTGRGVWYGAARTEARGTRGKAVYLIGGGNSAGQAALYFSSYAARVTLLIRADSVEKGMSQYLIEQLRGKANVDICTRREVVALRGAAHLEAMTIRDTRTGQEQEVETDSLFVFIGADAHTDWLPDAVRRDGQGYIYTGNDADAPDLTAPGHLALKRGSSFLETSVPGIFAAGDVRRGSIKRVAASVGEGSMGIALVHQYLAAQDETVHS
ncbi:FAD-dependent oxidoreductase [Deinococcus marmoris]|uniref:Thioredoxin reductase n=1 Tax=Deinococcus marmoris TaxID=249408 RepID=A0A1U7NQY7_9DEIO|nr:cyclic nucleotide-binding domain-containing thioredoxin-disulfide reductase [Deinococcus marmoris]OLV15331.1 Thioredoxin reductase [Deinococcus marmoris]